MRVPQARSVEMFHFEALASDPEDDSPDVVTHGDAQTRQPAFSFKEKR